MMRRFALGAMAAATLLGSGALFGTVTPAQAQVGSCDSWQRGAACVEGYFNMNPDPNDPRPASPYLVVQPTSQSASQAGPQGQSQPAGEE